MHGAWRHDPSCRNNVKITCGNREKVLHGIWAGRPVLGTRWLGLRGVVPMTRMRTVGAGVYTKQRGQSPRQTIRAPATRDQSVTYTLSPRAGAIGVHVAALALRRSEAGAHRYRSTGSLF